MKSHSGAQWSSVFMVHIIHPAPCSRSSRVAIEARVVAGVVAVEAEVVVVVVAVVVVGVVIVAGVVVL